MSTPEILDQIIAELIAHGLSDEEIASDLVAVGSNAHLALGHLVTPAALISVVRYHITKPQDHWISTHVGDESRQLCVAANDEGIVLDLWACNERGQAIGEEPVATGYLLVEDLLEHLGATAPWNQPWHDAGYDPHDQPTPGIRIEHAHLHLSQVTDAQLRACESFDDVLDALELWDLVDEADRRGLYNRWIQLHT